jgi:microcompartment protein CcmK/EutM
MRLGSVIGRVTLSRTVPALEGARWLVLRPYNRDDYLQGPDANSTQKRDPSPVVYDNLGGGVGQTIGYVEGREAASPFEEPTPIDAINVALVDKVFFCPFLK